MNHRVVLDAVSVLYCDMVQDIQNLVFKSAYEVRQLCTVMRQRCYVAFCCESVSYEIKVLQSYNGLFHKTGEFRHQ